VSCCGRLRQRLAPAGLAAGSGAVKRPTEPTASAPVLEYVGRTGLTAAGPITGSRYRFNRPGAQVVVDARDVPGLLAIPTLRRPLVDPESA
jgi:hypothetical protein